MNPARRTNRRVCVSCRLYAHSRLHYVTTSHAHPPIKPITRPSRTSVVPHVRALTGSPVCVESICAVCAIPMTRRWWSLKMVVCSFERRFLIKVTSSLDFIEDCSNNWHLRWGSSNFSEYVWQTWRRYGNLSVIDHYSDPFFSSFNFSFFENISNTSRCCFSYKFWIIGRF